MRRVVRAASPEVLRVGGSSSCSAETSFRELDEVFLQTQTRIWLGEVLHIRFDEETAIADLLSDGELLYEFQVSKIVWKMLLEVQVDLKHSKVYIYERTSSGKSDGRYMPYPKVDSFLKICQILGLTGIDLFSPSDVVEKRNVRRVCMCIRSLSKKARLKNLEVPDFDIVTYTIAMPNDLVGGIRRNLEQSYSSSSSNGCTTAFMDSNEIYRQKSPGGDHARHYDSYSESDEAESMLAEFECQSPLSNDSYDAANLSHIVGEISSNGNSFFDENSSKLQTEFQLDSQDHDGHKSVHFLESTNSSHARTIENGHDMFRVIGHGTTSSSCTEYQIGQGMKTCFADMGGIVYPISKPENGFSINNADVGCFETCASSFGDSSFLLGKKLVANGEAAFKEYIDTKLWGEGLTKSLSKCRAFDSVKDLDCTKEESMRSSVVPSRTQQIDCTGDRDGNSILEMHTSGYVGNNSLSGNCNGLQPGMSDLVLNSIDDGNFILSYFKMPASKYNLHMGSVDSKFELLKNEVKRKSVDKVVDAEVPSTPSLNAISDSVSEDEVDSNGCSADSFFSSDLHSLKVEEGSFKFGISTIEDVSAGEGVKNVNFYDMDTDEGNALLALKKNSSSVEIVGINRSSASGSESQSPPIFDSSDIVEREASATLRLDPISETHGLETGRLKLPVDSDGVCTADSNSIHSTKSLVVHNANLEVPNERQPCDIISSYDPANTSITHSRENSWQAPSCAVERETSAQESIEVKTRVLPPAADVLTSAKHDEADDTGEVEKVTDIKELKTAPVTTLVSNGRDKEGVADEPRRPGNKVLKSVAGGITFVGVMLLLLQLRQRRGRERRPKTTVPLQTQKPSQEGSARRRAEIGSTDMLYPAERLKF